MDALNSQTHIDAHQFISSSMGKKILKNKSKNESYNDVFNGALEKRDEKKASLTEKKERLDQRKARFESSTSNNPLIRTANNLASAVLSKKINVLEKSVEAIQRERAILSELADDRSGLKESIEILHLQKKMKEKSLSNAKKNEISREIADVFVNAKDHEKMSRIREAVDAEGKHSSNLFDLVYNQLNVADCHRIISAINEAAEKAYVNDPGSFHFVYKIYTDVDDTLKGTLNDRESKVTGFYPGVMNLLRTISEKEAGSSASKITLLSARPKALRSPSNKMMEHAFPKEIEFFSLYGSGKAATKAIKHYTYGKKAKNFTENRSDAKRGNLRLKKSAKKSETRTYTSFAGDKRANIDRDLLLRPEVRPIMIGDSGEGDLMFLQQKNSGEGATIDDPRIPPEYKERAYDEQERGSPVNYPNKPVFLGFIHDLHNHSSDSIRPNPADPQAGYEEKNIHIFNNYVDVARACNRVEIGEEKFLISHDELNKILAEAQEWIDSNPPSSVDDPNGGVANVREIQYREDLQKSINEV